MLSPVFRGFLFLHELALVALDTITDVNGMYLAALCGIYVYAAPKMRSIAVLSCAELMRLRPTCSPDPPISHPYFSFVQSPASSCFRACCGGVPDPANRNLTSVCPSSHGPSHVNSIHLLSSSPGNPETHSTADINIQLSVSVDWQPLSHGCQAFLGLIRVSHLPLGLDGWCRRG